MLLGTVRLDESADTRKRSWERMDPDSYPDSQESEDDVVYAEEHENEIQQINLRNEVTNQITVDTCGERCARLDDFNWVLPAKVWNEESDTPESDFETSDSGNSVHVNASVHWILRGYIKSQNVSRRGSQSGKQLLRLATEWRSRNVQIAVARTHCLRGVGASVRPDTILRRKNLRRK